MRFVESNWKPCSITISCVQALKELGETGAIPFLELLLSTRFPSLKAAAIDAFRELAPFRYFDLFQSLLFNKLESASVRLACLEGLFDSLPIHTLCPILSKLVHDENAAIRQNAIYKVRYLQLQGSLDKSPRLLEFVLNRHYNITNKTDESFPQKALGFISNIDPAELSNLSDEIVDSVDFIDLLETLKDLYPEKAHNIAKVVFSNEGAEINSPLCAEINPLPPDFESQQYYGIDI